MERVVQCRGSIEVSSFLRDGTGRILISYRDKTFSLYHFGMRHQHQ